MADETTAEKIKAALDEARADVDKVSSSLSSLVALVPEYGPIVSVALHALKTIMDTADDTIDAIVK
jgi:hypothetical protein